MEAVDVAFRRRGRLSSTKTVESWIGARLEISVEVKCAMLEEMGTLEAKRAIINQAISVPCWSDRPVEIKVFNMQFWFIGEEMSRALRLNKKLTGEWEFLR